MGSPEVVVWCWIELVQKDAEIVFKWCGAAVGGWIDVECCIKLKATVILSDFVPEIDHFEHSDNTR